MLDLNKDISIILSPVGRVELEFPGAEATFPVITLSEIDNGADYVVEGVEYTSDITFQVDVWDKASTREGCETLAKQVDTLMTAAGFRRVTSRGFKEPSGLQRKMLRYRIKVFNQEG